MGFVTGALALLILRKRKHNEHLVQPGFMKNIIPTLVVVFMLAYSIVAAAVVIDNWIAALIGVGLLLLFVAIFFIFYHKPKESQ
jgi:amino acid transporter